MLQTLSDTDCKKWEIFQPLHSTLKYKNAEYNFHIPYMGPKNVGPGPLWTMPKSGRARTTNTKYRITLTVTI